MKKAKSAERPLGLQVSSDEVVALIRYHSSCCKRIAKKYGQLALALSRDNPFTSGARLKVGADVAKAKVKEHSDRAKGLMSILPK